MFSLNKIFTNGIIFQRDTENNICGSTAPRNEIKVSLNQKGKEIFSAVSAADSSGKWCVTLPPVKGGFDAYEIIAESGGEKITLTDVLFGEVFHISGQSNMELPVCRTRDPFAPEEIFPEYKYIREFRTPIAVSFTKASPEEDFEGGEWKNAEGGNIPSMSAVGYHFARIIYERLNMPVGLLNTSAGGAAVESFMSYDMIKGYKLHDDFLEIAAAPDYVENTAKNDAERESAWIKALGNEDFGLMPSADMKSCTVPCHTEDIEGLKDFSGRIFFFKEIDMPEDFPCDNAELILGTIIDSDTVFINGVRVGETGYMYPPRYYNINKGILKPGKNIITVRMEIKGKGGGFTKGKRYCLKAGSRIIELAGEWKYAVAASCAPLEPGVFFQGLPLALYSRMFAPAMNIKCRAFLWYQGETNCGRAFIYKQMFTDFIEMYRKKCGYEIPVVFAQLPCFEGTVGREPSMSWAKFRQAQLECLDIPRSAMAVTLEFGEYNDLHPINKRSVAERLAKAAGELVYGDSPTFARCVSALYKDGRVILGFDREVFLRNGRTGAFEAVFEDGVFGFEDCGRQKPGKTAELVCRHEGIPSSVRYCYENDPHEIDLYDLTLSPVTPFEIKVQEV